MKKRKVAKRSPKSKNALIIVALVTVMITIPTFIISLKDMITIKAANNNSSGRWISLGMEGVNVGAIAVSPNFASDHTLFINSSEGIFKSTNAGHTWVKLTNGLPLGDSNYDDINSASVAISPNYAIDKTLFVNTFDSSSAIGALYRSQDGGVNWELVNHIQDGMISAIAISPYYSVDHTVFIGGATNFLAKSTNGGTSWQTLNPLQENSFWIINDFAFSPNYAVDQTIFAAITFGGEMSDIGGILKTTDRGRTWSFMVIPYDQSIPESIAVSPNYAQDHTIFAGTVAVDGIHHLIKSIDSGTTWHSASTGVVQSDVQDIVIAPDGNTLYAGTGGDGAYISTNSGSSWQILDNFPSSGSCIYFASLALSPQYTTDGTLFAACGVITDSGAGVWKHVLSKGPDRDFALLSPFNNGVTWTVFRGYFNNRDQSKDGCGVGERSLDHCRNQLFGLDMVPDQQDDTDILAPGNGKVAFRGKLPEENCIGLRITLDNGLNLNVCHFASFIVNQGERVVRGKVLGIRSTPHVHLSLDDRYRIGTLCPGKDRCFLPIPFDGGHTLEGMSLDPNPNGEIVLLPYPLCDERRVDCQFEVDFQQYKDTTGTSTNVAIP